MKSSTKDNLQLGLVIVVCVVVVVLVVYASYANQQKWEQFKADHHCYVIAHTASTTSYIVGTGKNGGVHPVITPSTTTYHCDDGVDYTRQQGE